MSKHTTCLEKISKVNTEKPTHVLTLPIDVLQKIVTLCSTDGIKLRIVCCALRQRFQSLKVAITLSGLENDEETNQNHRWQTLLNSCLIVQLTVMVTFFRHVTIDMSHCHRKESELGEALLNMKSLEVLDMTGCKIHCGGLSRIFVFETSEHSICKSLKTLNLSENAMNSGDYLYELMRRLENLTTLDLSYNSFAVGSLESLIDKFKAAKTLKHLNLENAIILSSLAESLSLFANNLQSLTHLETLNLNYGAFHLSGHRKKIDDSRTFLLEKWNEHMKPEAVLTVQPITSFQ